MMPARMYDLTAMKAPVEQPVLCRDLVSAQDFSPEETKSMFELTHIIKHRPADFRGALAGKQLVLFFEKASLRTRLTFEAGMASLGGTSRAGWMLLSSAPLSTRPSLRWRGTRAFP